MSAGYAELLLGRAKRYLESAEQNLVAGRFDVSSVEAEIAAQLALKALTTRLGFEPPRTHSVRQLFSFIIDNGLLPQNAVEWLKRFVKQYREGLMVLERSRIVGEYGVAVDRDEAEISLNISKEVAHIVEKY